MSDKKIVLDNIDKIHTTKLGKERIKKNLNIKEDAVDYLKNIITHKDSVISKNGKNYYCIGNNTIITINSYNYCVITAHIV